MESVLLFQKKTLRYLGLFFLSVFFCSGIYAQSTITGTVTDGTGPIPGANVVVKGTSNGAVTDFDGNYTLNNVPGDAVLVFSFVGYEAKEVPVNNRTEVNAVLENDLQSLSEVVVIGYGTQNKESVTGSVVSLDGDELEEVQVANFQQALQGRAPGVQITTTSTRPGANNSSIRIRGVRSLSGSNDPLIVLNGIPFSGGLNDISINDIASIDILKDASATAIYGSRGANGVILITTKTGQKGQKATFSYNTYYATKEVFAKYPMMNGPQFVALREATAIPNDGVPLYQNYGADEDPNVNTDWQDLIYGTGLQTNHDFSVSGGTENGSYSFGGGYFKETSVLPVENFQRYSLRAQIDQQIGAFRFGINSIMNWNVTNAAGTGLYGNLSATPILDPYNEDGTLKRVVSMPADDFWVTTRSTVKALGEGRVNLQKDFGTYNNLYGEVSVPGVEGLKYRLNIGLNLRTSRDGFFNGQGVGNIDPFAPNSAGNSSSLFQDYVIENLVTFDRTFADKHKVNIVGLYSVQNSKSESSFLNARNIPNEQFLFYNLDSALLEDITGYGSDYGENGLESVMGRAIYQYDNRYLLTATVRSDGSSRLAPGNKWVTYPAISLGWNVANEKFMQDVSWLSQLKLRAGYGETSNQAVNNYATLGNLGIRNYNFGDTFATGYFVNELPNASLGWEFSETYNYGIDFGLFNNRLSGTVEYYTTQTNDILYRVGLPSTSGVGSFVGNIGSTENKGVEVALNAIILDNPDGFTWDFGINLYTNRNEITSLAGNQDRNEGQLWFVGSPINVIYDHKNIGLWNEDDPDFQYLQTYEPGGNVGMIKVEYTGEFNEDGSPVRQINADDRQIIDPTPDFQGGFNTRLAYKNFDFNVVGAFQSGGTLISTLYSSAGYLNLLTGRRNNIDVDYWTPTNTDAKYPAPGGIQDGDGPRYGRTMGYFDGSYLKFRAMTLGYNFESNLVEKVGLQSLRLYATVQNPFVLFSPYHKESGMDPETNSGADGSGNAQNSATGTAGFISRGIATIGTNVPTTRNFLLGLNVKF
ncbi:MULTISPECIES: TonB-dependent receptor [unclassified Leeuwenhoekiella]|uniref:SusC/RagA family TonB-linked outer membrane protein n=1 Tax=unclassified Leeuwenhoekiella TaxID=2615029 RepID=UPI000C4F808A|nr:MULTISPECIES: TonB-dependent receptor [unclassified Leeuwenhoekiella]MAW94808.1 SusC/RagA family protein [Leeuwenhoekiella sp.]MBA79528.1 SusC/RagA family protein [Leeuwenhoekiella sp.]|tara:strand:+ start:38240 stop:41359 length:3120 start_codon:yes stop_codon:yes gene_type:complete